MSHYTLSLVPRSLINRAASWRSDSSLSLPMPSSREGDCSIFSSGKIHRESEFTMMGALPEDTAFVAVCCEVCEETMTDSILTSLVVVVVLALLWLDVDEDKTVWLTDREDEDEEDETAFRISFFMSPVKRLLLVEELLAMIILEMCECLCCSVFLVLLFLFLRYLVLLFRDLSNGNKCRCCCWWWCW